MADTKISQLPVATTVAQSEYILIDNGVVTRITPVINLSSLFTTNTEFNNLSSNSWNNTYTTVRANSSSWIYVEQPATTLVKANSGLWNSTYTVVYSNSAYWMDVLTAVSPNSATWNSVSQIVNANSGNWTNTYTTVSSNSAVWSQGSADVNTQVKSNSANWNSTYTTVSGNSALWSQVNPLANSVVTSSSANWNSTYTTVSGNSATWSQVNPLVNSVVTSNSANWNSTYTTVSTNSATWSQGNADVNALVISSSANWNSAYAVTSASRVLIDALTTSYTLALPDSGRVKTTSIGAPITAYISPTVNVDGFNTSIAQLSTGTITIALCASYTTGRLVSFGNLYQTGGQGAIVNILRAGDNTFLITGLLQ